MNQESPSLERIDLNEATQDRIERDLGLNAGLSSAIVAYRRREGRIKALSELLNVPGFDARLLQTLRPRIVI